MYRKFAAILVGALSLGFVQTAFAADMPVKAKAAPIVLAPTYNWTGGYVGLFAGGAWGGSATDPDPTSTAAPFIGCYNCAPGNSYRLGSGFTGGLTLGYNWQGVASPLVIGIEGEFGYLRTTASQAYSSVAFPSAAEMTATTTVGNWYATLTPRIGYAWDKLLVYVKGGVAVANEKVSFSDTTASIANPGLINGSANTTTWGAALGGGLEYAFAPKWSVKAEYLYLGVNKTITACGLNTGVGSAGVGATFCSAMSVPAVHTAKIGVNYHFN